MNRFGGPPFTWADCKGSEDVTPEDLYLDWVAQQARQERERRERERRLEAEEIREQVPEDSEDRMAA